MKMHTLAQRRAPMWQPEFLWFFTIFHHEFRKNNVIAFEGLMV
jgi:hypothetical protein